MVLSLVSFTATPIPSYSALVVCVDVFTCLVFMVVCFTNRSAVLLSSLQGVVLSRLTLRARL